MITVAETSNPFSEAITPFEKNCYFLLEFQGVGIFVASKPTKLPQKTPLGKAPGSSLVLVVLDVPPVFFDAKKRDA